MYARCVLKAWVAILYHTCIRWSQKHPPIWHFGSFVIHCIFQRKHAPPSAMRHVSCLYPAWVIHGPRPVLTLRISTGRRGTTTPMRCLVHPRWCPKRQVSPWSFFKRSGLGKCKGRAGGLCNRCNHSLVIGVFFLGGGGLCIHVYVHLMFCVCVCVTSRLLKLHSSSMTLHINQKLSRSMRFESLVFGRRPNTHREKHNLYYTHRLCIWRAYSCQKKRCQS